MKEILLALCLWASPGKLEQLGSDHWEEREKTQRVLESQYPLNHLLLWSARKNQDLEVRTRCQEILHQKTSFLPQISALFFCSHPLECYFLLTDFGCGPWLSEKECERIRQRRYPTIFFKKYAEFFRVYGDPYLYWTGDFEENPDPDNVISMIHYTRCLIRGYLILLCLS